ncbi:MAG: hypothetical protein BZ133_04880 [Methanosphaera sp. SHI613]|jgi:tRNA U34 5-methylaminomethyl-2-thiouridine-forming methyltransferase MnmC|nr:MAG: hypothetical protein BZ133_04880 [Methanosphaera sp. SHI613]
MSDDDTHSRLELLEQNKLLIHELFQLEQDGHKDARELYHDEIAGFFVRTDDDSYTLTSAKRDSGESETLHSKFGAFSEAYEKFVNPSNLLEIAQNKKSIRVLDICSGIGYNTTALLTHLKDEEDVEIEIDMVESSIETLATVLFIPNVSKAYGYVKKEIESFLIDNGYLQFNKVLSNVPSNIHINIHACDARDFIKNEAKGKYDAVFLDPYSPSKSPELYTIDFFARIKEFLEDYSLILTYTAASPVRSAFVHAGYHIGEGPTFHRSGGTIASLSADMIKTPLSFSDQKVIALSDVGVPYIDSDLNDDYDTIVNRRQDTREKIRGVSVFPSSSKLPRYLGLNPDTIEDVNLRNKLNSYVEAMGFESINDYRIHDILNIDSNLPSRDQILALEENLHNVLGK